MANATKERGVHPDTPQSYQERMQQLARKPIQTILRLARNRGIYIGDAPNQAALAEQIARRDFPGGGDKK